MSVAARAAAVVAAALASLCGNGVLARDAPAALRKQQLQTEQRQLQQRIERLRRQLAEAEASHSEAADALAASEAAISQANRRLHELAQGRRQLEQQLAALEERMRAVSAREEEQHRRLAQSLREALVAVQISPWQRVFLDGAPGAQARDLAYLDQLLAHRQRTLQALRERRAELTQLQAEALAKREELAAIAADETRNRAHLLQQQAARKQTLARLARQIAAQRQSIATLQRDEKRLANLIEQINRVLADQARRSAARPATPPAASGAAGGSKAVEVEPPTQGAFARLRGKLPLPVQGEIVAHFGTPRRTEAGVDAPTWKGIFIRAPEGSAVHAIARGRVVFADWLRGFGNLLILDHGEGFLSVYGNNETLLRAVGETVEAGQAIAAVGNTGGNALSGLYFEIRYEGRPVDPLKWVQAR
ncbi:MAG: peptidoglycan DD-metalloendopeptidase family protein [Sutterellaceae bacterium]|nr:peptidoglycan DD-metalloendopeptidase family protein [Burkholderiaceae bacterium]MDW8429409.1 peptidoglycan DD-metalloendopeptidase family protein [Sutterellaceae bacterium]